MSPSPAVPLEVERYIGACLISNHNSNHHHKIKVQTYHGNKNNNINKNNHNQGEYHHHIVNHQVANNNNNHNREVRYPQNRICYNRGNEECFRTQRCNNSLDGWAGGMPLISFANQHRNHHQQYQHRRTDHHQQLQQQNHRQSSTIEDYNLARLAVHTQGAPLILTKSYNHNSRKNKSKNQNNNNNSSSNNRYVDNFFAKQHNNNNRGVNVNNNNKSDTSGNNSVNFTVDTVSVTSDESYGSGNSDQCLPRIIKPRKRRKKDRKLPIFDGTTTGGAHRRQDFPDFSSSSESASPEIVNPTCYLTLTDDALLDFRDNGRFGFPDVPEITTFDEIEEDAFDESKSTIRSNSNNNNSMSRCQCRYCDPSGRVWYDGAATFLSPPDRTDVFEFPDYETSTTSTDDDASLLLELATLRLLDDDDDDDFEETSRRRRRSVVARGDLSAASSDLEVSSEIVTSLNGQRDLEIKFFSTATANGGSVGVGGGKSNIGGLVIGGNGGGVDNDSRTRTCNNNINNDRASARNSDDIETC